MGQAKWVLLCSYQPLREVQITGILPIALIGDYLCSFTIQERNFHIFYYLYAGLDQAKLQALLLKVSDFTYSFTSLSVGQGLH
jgi:hypothetical protein